ncbi:starvation-inducible DNA-binding protein [Belnapia rosea]|uniref:Starvation-inducible DNA-binding protein n=2 Tax=Belnapia rosea TaxID=938405 RepID=A0A1G7C9Q2_9PROT|nr:starvation-inducible DNA-binding protein [Belnapia rosea]
MAASASMVLWAFAHPLIKDRRDMTETKLQTRRLAALRTPNGLSEEALREVPAGLTAVLADVMALFVKTKNFHWHVSGPHFRDYHRMFDEQSAELMAMVDPLAERARKLGGATLRSIGQVGRLQSLLDNDADYVSPQDMLAELREDNGSLVSRMRALHGVCDEHGDVATASLLENWIDEGEGRVWFLFEAGRRGNG